MTATAPEPPPGGHVRAYRAEMNEAVWSSPELWYLWSWCKFRAAHEPRTLSVMTGKGSTLVELGAGQFLFGRKAASEELGWPGKTIENRLKRLEDLGKVARQPASHYTIVTVCDYPLYNGRLTDTGQPTGQPPAQQWPGNGQAPGHKKIRDNQESLENQRVDDHLETCSWKPELESTVVSQAREIAKDVKPSRELRQRRRDVETLLKIAYLSEAGRGEIPADAIVQARQAIQKRSDGPPDKPVAYFHNEVNRHVSGRLNKLLSSVCVPTDLLDRLLR